jgi:hypothetical protein
VKNKNNPYLCIQSLFTIKDRNYVVPEIKLKAQRVMSGIKNV